MTFPGSATPFGLVRLGPDTVFGAGPKEVLNRFNMATGGYHHAHDRVLGFSHTRLSGTGVSEGGLFRVRPVTDPGDFEKRKGLLGLVHGEEAFEAGYYSIRFPDQGILAEVSSTPHCGFHRYTRLDAGKHLQLLLDVGSSLPLGATGDDSEVSVDPARRTLSGKTRLKGQFSSRFGGLDAYFFAEFSPRTGRVRLWQDQRWLPAGSTAASGQSPGAGLELSDDQDSIELKLCISTVSQANARLNFEAEARDLGFDQARAQAHDAWDAMFSRARIRSQDPSLLRGFYTALYHSMLMPTNFTDVNGEYMGFDRKVHVARDFTYRTDLSLWDTFRTTHPLYSLIAPEIQRDSVMSLIEMGKLSGVLPRWPSGLADSGSMFGSPANFLIAEAWLKGIHDFDVEAALDLMIRGATQTVPGVPGRDEPCIRFGYCPSDLTSGSVSMTLEQAWADSATANLAGALGQTAVEAEYRERAHAWRHHWNPANRYFCPKDSRGKLGAVSPDLLSYFGFLGHGAQSFTEGSANQWRYSVPHEPRELVRLFGGPEAFVAELERFLRGASRQRSSAIPVGRYWHGNEHDLHAIYLFNEAGHPELTQKWVRWALNTRYADSPDGLDGNDDGGALSAWFALSTLGLYPQAGSDLWWLGAPQVEEATLDLGSGHTLHLVAHGQGPRNAYVQKVLLNGVPLCEPRLRHAELQDGKLEFFLGPRAAPQGGFACQRPEPFSS